MSKWEYRAAVYNGPGKIRTNNEDAYYFNGEFSSIKSMDLPIHIENSGELKESMWAVCDGMGGHSNGEVASSYAVSTMNQLKQNISQGSFQSEVQRWVRQADRNIAKETDGGGCTLALLYCHENCLDFAHIGDSRIYRLHEGKLIQLTTDHTKVAIMVAAGFITPEEARYSPQRHIITRALGMTGPEVICSADIGYRLPAVNNDRYLLCSDGITDMLTDDEISRIMIEAANADSCAQKLYETAMAAGGRDNLTAMVLEIIGNPNGDSHTSGTYFYDDDDEPTIEHDEDHMITSDNKETIEIDLRQSRDASQSCRVFIRDSSGSETNIHVTGRPQQQTIQVKARLT